MFKIIIALMLIVMITSCHNLNKPELKDQSITLNGNWEYLGYGRAVTIRDSTVQGFHLSSAGNVKISENTITDYFNYYSVDTLSADTIILKDGVKSFKLHRSNENFASNINDSLANDPKYNFDILWNTFNEQYAYFKERNIDWDKVYSNYAPKVNSETSPLELYLIFEEILESMNDGHVSIDLPDEIEDKYLAHRGDNKIGEDATPKELEDEVKDLVINKYLKDVNTFNQGEITWGLINDDVAYIQTYNMISWAYYPIADNLTKDEFWKEWWNNLNRADNHHDDVASGTKIIMDSIIQGIGDVEALIIDLRFNGGGFDDASVEILNHFVEKRTDISSKKVRLGTGFTEKQVLTLVPSDYLFDRDLYILTSHETASAAELLVLGSKEIPSSKTIGSTTEGVFSDILHKKLPNGWRYGLSNMVYESMEGVSYENIGIRPDYQLNYPIKSSDFYKYLLSDIEDGDDAIEKVLDLVSSN